VRGMSGSMLQEKYIDSLADWHPAPVGPLQQSYITTE
jgi:hypothetical protein